jgi:hypothetical protein
MQPRGPVLLAVRSSSLGDGDCVPGDLNPHVSEGGLEPLTYITAGTDPWLGV